METGGIDLSGDISLSPEDLAVGYVNISFNQIITFMVPSNKFFLNHVATTRLKRCFYLKHLYLEIQSRQLSTEFFFG